MHKIIGTILLSFLFHSVSAQVKWVNVDSSYQPLPASVHIYRTNDSLGGKPNIAYYLIADLKDKNLLFDADTTYKRRLTPTQFYEKSHKPVVVINCSFFSFATSQTFNVIIKDKKLVSHNVQSLRNTGNGWDSVSMVFPFRSAFGIKNNRQADIAWLYSDSAKRWPSAFQMPVHPTKLVTLGNSAGIKIPPHDSSNGRLTGKNFKKKWKMQTAVGGGPVLLQNGQIKISNEEELMFTGKAINDKHPRTAMGYTKDSKLIILVIQGRYPAISEGATLNEEAQIFKDLRCWEALNLDGGGSSCLLINGKTTITPSEKGVQRPVPAVFLIKSK